MNGFSESLPYTKCAVLRCCATHNPSERTPSMTSTTRTVTIKATSCGNCGIQFGLEANFMSSRRDDGESFYCPNGHFISWNAANKMERLKASEVALRDQLEASAHELERTKGALLRDRQRFANGVCPCCNRSFENVRRHMATKHPEYDVTQVQGHAAPKIKCSCGRTFTSVRGLHRHQNHQRSDDWYEPGVRWGSHLTVV